MKTTCTVSVSFTGAHRLAGTGIPCEALHGHFYRVDFTFESAKLDDLGMIIEFEETERTLAKWFTDNWDHNIILCKSDKALGDAISAITKQKIFYLDFSPTAENLAQYLISEVCPKLFAGKNAVCTKIHMQETTKFSATVTL
jgi:6-pyruvoyltetrahydropterin/6-carboxytetrahydropterin synthase